jgi:hypothetical protein
MYPIRTYKTPARKNRRYPVDMTEVTTLNNHTNNRAKWSVSGVHA